MSTRTTPYELVLEPFETTAFPAIRNEAAQRGVDPRRRDQFVLLGHVGVTLKEIVPEDAPADALEEYAEFLFHGFQFWTFGRRLYVFDLASTDRITSPTFELRGWQLAAPPAAYLQLPYQRVWARIESEAPYEPVDGIFVMVDDTEPAPEAGAHLRMQLVLGLRRDRPGLSLISYRTDLDPRAGVLRGVHPTRQDGTAFANVIPGGERMGYRTLVTTAEFEALVLRALFILDRETSRLEQGYGSTAENESTLDHVLVRG